MSYSEKIRVAFLVPFAGMSGAAEFDVDLIAPPAQPLIQVARKLGWTTCVKIFPNFVSTSIEIADTRILNPLAVAYDLFVVIRVALWLSQYVRQHQIQILYTGAITPHLVGILSGLMQPRLQLIVHLQTIISPRLAGGLGRAFFSRVVRRAARVVAVSKAVAETLPPSDRVVLVYNGADIAAYEAIETSTLRQELNIPANQPLIGVIGRLTPWKGHRVFLDAAAKLVQKGLPGHFIVVGDDVDPISGRSQYRPLLEDYAKTLGIQDRVTFTGFRKDIPNVMRGLDILVIPSLRPDPSPLVTVEGLASGIPVVGSNSGGIAEVILDGKTGRLFPPGDSLALATILDDLISQPALRVEYGKAGLKRAKTDFAVERYTSALIDMFRQVSGDSARAGKSQ